MAATGYTPILIYASGTPGNTPAAGNLTSDATKGAELALNYSDGKLFYKDDLGVVQLLASKSGASGSVTSVAQSFTGGLISVSGSPITTSGTLALTVAGTSGGIPYFSSGTTWATSAALDANAIVLGGGAGAAPATTTTGTGVVTAIGNAVNTTNGLVTQTATLTSSALLLGGGSGTGISSTTTGTGVVTAIGNNTNSANGLAVLNASAALAVANGGTGQTTYTDGQLLIGNTTGNTLTKATLTQGSGITITNGSGAITIANASPMTYPGAGIPNSTGSAWGTSYTTTGSGTVVALATSPSFTTPTLGVASATTINKVTITTPATGSTLTIADGKTLTVNNSIALTGTDSTTMTFPSTSQTLAGLNLAQTFTATNTFWQVIYTVNTVTVSSNAGTVPITYRLNNFTNSSAATMTITMATASAVDGQMSIVRIYDASAVAQTITWVNTENSTVTAPTTSNGSTTLPLTVGFMYNSATSKWRCIASA